MTMLTADMDKFGPSSQSRVRRCPVWKPHFWEVDVEKGRWNIHMDVVYCRVVGAG